MSTPHSLPVLSTLLVEDSLEFAQVMSDFIELIPDLGLEFTVCSRLSEALERLEHESFELILLDLNLPDSRGIKTCRRVRRAAPDAAVVIISGMDDESLALETVAGGAQEYLGKDELNPRSLRRAIRYALERTRAQAARREHTLFMEAAHRVGRMGVWQRDLRTGRLSWPERTCELFGIGAEGFGGTVDEFHSLVHPDDLDRVKAAMPENVKDGNAEELEYRIIRSDGETRWLQERGTVERDGRGRATRVFGVVIDVTERKAMEQQVLRAQRMDSVGALAGGIAHDLNNIFSPITMAADLLKRKCGDGRQMELLDSIRNCAQRGAEMVSQILSFARGMEGRRVEVQVSHVVRDIEKVIRETFPKNISTEVSLANPLPTFHGDPTQIHQILMNLCVNARDAMPGGGELRITVDEFHVDRQYSADRYRARDGRHVRITVRDTGTGIPAKYLGKLFDPFFSTKEAGKGTGLGLSTVHSIVQAHGGFIEVDSKEGKGSRFAVHLPVAQRTRGPEEVAANAAPVPPGSGELILVVDDEQTVRQITKSTLESFGYRVITAGDGAEGVARYSEHRAEVRAIVSDMIMPVMDGLGLVRVIRRMDADIPLIVASGGVRNGQEDKLYSEGVTEYLPKPFTVETVLRALARVLGKLSAEA
ncbi:MAG: response regulator [Opitutales bacterium]|nr:response regulator [Opitutales bacterium]